MSNGLQDAGLKIGDYQSVPDKTLYNNIGPQCNACRKPYRQCECPPKVYVPGEAAVETPVQRQATALEMIAFQLGKIVKHLDAKALSTETLQVVPEDLIQAAGVILPSVVDGVPVLDPQKIADNEAKKAALLGGLGGKK